jgi:hypothetical protein
VDGKVNAIEETVNAKNIREAEILTEWAQAREGELAAVVTLRSLLSSTATSWSCKSSVMETTKNRMTKAQLIAMIFCRLLGRRDGCSATRERLLPSSANPASARPSQMRLSASSMFVKVMVCIPRRWRNRVYADSRYSRSQCETQELGGLGAAGVAGAAGAAGASAGTGLLNRESSICGSISIFSAVRVCLI